MVLYLKSIDYLTNGLQAHLLAYGGVILMYIPNKKYNI